MTRDELQHKIKSFGIETSFPEKEILTQFLTIKLASENTHQFIAKLKESDTSFDYLFCQTGIDFPSHMEVLYHLRSTSLDHEVVIKARIENRENPIIDSVYDLYKTGIYYCDLKEKNLLYHQNSHSGNIQIILADIGGLYFTPGNKYSNLLFGTDMEGTKLTFIRFTKDLLEIIISGKMIGYVPIDEANQARMIGNNFTVVNIEGTLLLQNDLTKEVINTPLYICFKESTFCKRSKNYIDF